jgi:hypothetical protein
MIGDKMKNLKLDERQIASDFAQLLVAYPNRAILMLANDHARKYNIHKSEIFQMFYAEFGQSPVTYRQNIKMKPEIQACEEFAALIRKHKSIDLLLVGEDISKKYKMSMELLANLFKKRFKLVPFEYKTTEWEYSSTGGGIKALDEVRRREELKRNREAHQHNSRGFNSKTPKFIQSSRTLPSKTSQEKAWDKLMVMVTEVKTVVAL